MLENGTQIREIKRIRVIRAYALVIGNVGVSVMPGLQSPQNSLQGFWLRQNDDDGGDEAVVGRDDTGTETLG
jgi:hypothetical protein